MTVTTDGIDDTDDAADSRMTPLDLAGWVAARYTPDHLVLDAARCIVAQSPGASRFLRRPSASGAVLEMPGASGAVIEMPGASGAVIEMPSANGAVLEMIDGFLKDTLARLLHDADAGRLPARGVCGGPDLPGLGIVIERLPLDAASPDHLVVLFLEQSMPATGAAPALRLATASDDAQFRRMTDLVPVIVFTMTPDLVIDHVNRAFCDFTGLPSAPSGGRAWEALLHPSDHDESWLLWVEAVATGQTFEREHRLRTGGGAWRWHLTRCVPQHGADGRLLNWICASVDIHQRRRAEARQRLLLTELQHRSKNILAVVRSLLSRTLDTSTDLDDFAAHLSGRISALARTQGVLARTVDGAVGLEELAHQEVMAHGGQEARQVTIEGPPVMLTDKVAETLGLALHELTTNALKFGALSTPLGQVSLTWKRVRPLPGLAALSHAQDAGPHDVATFWEVALVWQESGVAIDPADIGASGFGRELVERGLPYELGAETSMAFNPDGLRCEIRFPLRVEQEGGPLADRAA